MRPCSSLPYRLSGATVESTNASPAAGGLRDEWVRFLDRWSWDLFGTLTFREDTHPESAFKRFRVFLSIINRKLYGPRWFKHRQGVTWCCALERQRRGVVHFHCLLKSRELVQLLSSSWSLQDDGRWSNELLEAWNDLAGFARIEPIKSSELVRNYVSKYCIKGGEIELGGPGMPEQRLTGHPARVDRPWLTTAVGRASAWTILERVTTPDERAALMSWAKGQPGALRSTADLRASVRVRALAYRAGVSAS